jgi:acetoin:2,6-dichlorophenolindophenol oxidoreductase subunit beta
MSTNIDRLLPIPGAVTYCEAICSAHEYLLANYPEVFVIGQGVWSPWYVGNSMKGLDARFGRDRIIDTPVSENACTGMALGASLFGYRPIVVHPRMDFLILASDSVVNQAAKWSYMFGGRTHPLLTIRAIVNRGGEQGAQHSQALHSWYSHIPGLRVVMPATASDARDLLIASVLCDDPVLYIDDRWLYSIEGELSPAATIDLTSLGPQTLRRGEDISLVACGWSTELALRAAAQLANRRITAEVIDLRVLNPIDHVPAVASVRKTGRLIAIDGGWSNCGMAAEIIAGVSERLRPQDWRCAPRRITLPHAPAPSSKVLEDAYYVDVDQIVETVDAMISSALANT